MSPIRQVLIVSALALSSALVLVLAAAEAWRTVPCDGSAPLACPSPAAR